MLSLHATATAQAVRVSVRANVSVSGLDRASGPAGTPITIRGQGFDARTTVFVGGRQVQLESVSPTALVFRLPPAVGNGQVVVRHPAAPQMIAGTVVVEVAPTITRVTAGTRRVGTQIDIQGAGFLAGDRVFLGAVELPVVRLTPTRLTATLAPGATTATLAILRGSTGQRFETNVTVQIEAPAPMITAIQPLAGPPGTVVRISVTSFQPGDEILFGRARLPIRATGPGWVEVVIPSSRRPTEQLTVRSARGSSTFAQPFQLSFPPVVRTLATRDVRGGTQIVIGGSGFGADSQVTIAGVLCPVVGQSPTQLVVQLPGGIRGSHPVVVTTGGQQVTSAATLDMGRPGRGRGRR
ncbi:MAG: IPT/TIG domain-containing protein [Myxococcales bacterium]|nr:IPT/TIG domain-containing protein [Myxococcales bacterium]